jgi:integrase
VERTGSTKTNARNNLLAALKERSSARGTEGLTPDSRFAAAAALWIADVLAAGKSGEASPNTAELYERQLRNHVLPALGALRLREVTTPRVDGFLRGVRDCQSVATARTCRSVVSGVMRLAIRYGAVTVNPTREVTRIGGAGARQPRALTPDERAAWLAQLAADPAAVRADLPDLTRWMLATGVRIGEALAVSWDEVDLEAGLVTIRWKLIRVRGDGLVRVPRLKGAQEDRQKDRVLRLPPFALVMLCRRAVIRGRSGPLFPDSIGGWRDPKNTARSLRAARGTAGFRWVTSHVFRKTVATVLDEGGHTARAVADQLGHSKVSMTQDVYMARGVTNPAAADTLQRAMGKESSQ